MLTQRAGALVVGCAARASPLVREIRPGQLRRITSPAQDATSRCAIRWVDVAAPTPRSANTFWPKVAKLFCGPPSLAMARICVSWRDASREVLVLTTAPDVRRIRGTDVGFGSPEEV